MNQSSVMMSECKVYCEVAQNDERIEEYRKECGPKIECGVILNAIVILHSVRVVH